MILNERKQNEISSTIAFIKKLKPQQKKTYILQGFIHIQRYIPNTLDKVPM